MNLSKFLMIIQKSLSIDKKQKVFEVVRLNNCLNKNLKRAKNLKKKKSSRVELYIEETQSQKWM